MFVRQGRDFVYLTEDEINNQKVTIFKKERGIYLEKEEALKLIKQLASAYNLTEINELINFRNKEIHLADAGFDFANQGRYIRCNRPVYKFKEFNRKTKTNRIRKMTCDFCGKHFTSESDDGYYKFTDTFMLHQDMVEHMMEEACSEFCIKKIWDELLVEWLKKEELLDLVKDYIKN